MSQKLQRAPAIRRKEIPGLGDPSAAGPNPNIIQTTGTGNGICAHAQKTNIPSPHFSSNQTQLLSVSLASPQGISTLCSSKSRPVVREAEHVKTHRFFQL